MSLPNFDPQRSFFDAAELCARVLSQAGAGRFKLFRQEVWPALAKQREKLAQMYCPENGRPAEEPVRMMGILILQFMERLPDRQAAEACTYDLRWKHALDLQVDEVGCHPTSLVKFRNRLVEHGLESVGFDAVLDSLREAGYVRKKKIQRLDSTHIVGLVSSMSRLECVRETLRLGLQRLGEEKRLARPANWAVWWERYVESQVDFRATATELKNKMDQAGEDAWALLEWSKHQELSMATEEALEVLQRVFEENYERGDERIDQRRAQPPGAVHNPHDPQAQWSRKATICGGSKEWVGYKAQVEESVEEPVGEKNEPTKAVLTAVVAEEAPSSDKSAIVRVEQDMQERGEPLPKTLYTDAGYNGGAEIARFEREGRSLPGPVQAAPGKAKGFRAEAFEVDVEGRTAICPAGRSNRQCSRLEAGTGKVTYRFEWGATCRDCELFSQCVSPGQPHRTLTVGEHHNHIQARRQAMKTDAFKTMMHPRNGIEGTISELVRAYGFRRSRYRGLAKTRLQSLMIGAACNLKRWSKRLEWESWRAPPAAIKAQATLC